jgi:hypothetical protein
VFNCIFIIRRNEGQRAMFFCLLIDKHTSAIVLKLDGNRLSFRAGGVFYFHIIDDVFVVSRAFLTGPPEKIFR